MLISGYTSFSISFSTYSTVRTHFSPVVSSTYSSVRLVTVSPSTFSLSLTLVLPGLVRTANFGKSALDGRSWPHAMLLVPSPWIRIRSSESVNGKCIWVVEMHSACEWTYYYALAEVQHSLVMFIVKIISILNITCKLSSSSFICHFFWGYAIIPNVMQDTIY